MKTKPSAEALLTAAEWLDFNEGEGSESVDCKAVAEWLRGRAAAASTSAHIDSIVRLVPGVSRSRARRAIKETAAHPQPAPVNPR